MILREAPIVEKPNGSIDKWSAVEIPNGFCLSHGQESIVVLTSSNGGRLMATILHSDGVNQKILVKGNCRAKDASEWLSARINDSILSLY